MQEVEGRVQEKIFFDFVKFFFFFLRNETFEALLTHRKLQQTFNSKICYILI